MVTQQLTIRLDEKELPEIRMVSGDIGREIRIEVYAREDSDTPIDLETYSAEITIIKPDNTFIMDNFDGDEYELPENAGAVSGSGYYQIKIYTSGTRQIYTGQGPFLVDDMILSDDVIESSSIAFGDRFPEDFATKTWVDDEIEAAGIGTYVAGNPAGEETMPPLVRLQINDDIYPISHKIEEMEDADITTPAAGDVLTYDADDQKWKNEPLVIPDPTVTKTATGNPIEFSDGADAPLVKCVTAITGYQSGTGTPSPDNVRPIVAYTEGEIEVSDGDGNTTTYTIDLNGACYRGTLDVVRGKLVITHGEYILNSVLYVNRSGPKQYYINAARTPNSIRDGEIHSILCDKIRSKQNWESPYIDGICFVNESGAIRFNTVNAYETAADMLSDMGDLQFVYPYNTPVEIDLSPTVICTLSGYSHIESTTGEMEVEYITQHWDAIMTAAKLDNMKVYSTAEQVVGKWIDGRDIYERTIDIGSFSVSSWEDHTIESSTNINLLIDYAGYMVESNIIYALPDPSVRIKIDQSHNLIFTGTSSWNVTSGYITIRYIKL